MRTEFSLDCTSVLLEWRVTIPTCFQKDVVSLAEGIEALVIPIQPVGDLEEDRSQFGSISPVSEEAFVPGVSLPLHPSILT